MTDQLKTQGASCPKCSDPYPAETQQAGQQAKWECHKCGARGSLIGDIVTQPKAAGKPAKSDTPEWLRRNFMKHRP